MDVNIFIPDFLKIDSSSRIKGYVLKTSDDVLGIYIYAKYSTDHQEFTFNKCCNEWTNLNEQGVLDGYIISNHINDFSHEIIKCSNCMMLESENGNIKIKRLFVNGEDVDLTTVKKSVVMFYDYSAILKSEDLFSFEEHTTLPKENINQFAILKTIVKHNSNICTEQKLNDQDCLNYVKKYSFLKILIHIYKILCGYSNLCVQFGNSITSLHWIFYCTWKEKKISVRTGNLITSILLDLLGGIFVLHCINLWTVNPVNELLDIIESIVDYLRTLLKWLMGSPAGLKLNHAFNNMLGKCFLYHIELWWVFLVISKDILQMVLQVFQYMGILGISFQSAIFADILSLASFHIYCIYTYAARLYNIQLSGLFALWRLFLGRKHNPLRGGVDSCQYNHHQLFVGTLAFTILLFLFPTTALYYVVFTTLRVILLSLGGILSWIRYIVQSSSLYLILLWLLRSKRIAGEIRISLVPCADVSSQPILLRVHLQIASIFLLIQKYQPPPFSKPVAIQWREIISNLCCGKLLYPV